jgi:hypothetical protein
LRSFAACELDQVLGIDRALLARLHPLVTVHFENEGHRFVEISARVTSGYALKEWNQGEDSASEDFDAASDSQSCLALLDS